VARAGQPRADQAVGRVEGLLGPGDRLAELPVALALDVAGGVDAIAERRAAGRDVLEEAPRDHVVGVALGRARELSVLTDGGKAAGQALGVDGAQQRGAAVRYGQRGDEITAMRARRCFGRDGRDDQKEETRRQRRTESILATHGGEGCPGIPSPSAGSVGGAMTALCGSSATTDGLRQPVAVRSTGPAAGGRMLSCRAGSRRR
jgi:hypothetical protein